MNGIKAFLKQPKFRSGVIINKKDNIVILDYREQGCDLVTDGTDLKSLLLFLNDITKGNLSIKMLADFYSEKIGDIEEYLEEFDRLGLLEEGRDEVLPLGSLSGEDFYYSRLLPMVIKIQSRLGDSLLYSKMKMGTVVAQEIIGFGLEYYHLVKISPALIAPSLGHVQKDEIRKKLIGLFVEEYDHDRMLAKCLKAVGIDEAILINRQPLASTLSANASLGIYSRSHPLTFISALFLFETPSNEFNVELIKSCQRLNMPDAFYKPLIKHSEINEEEAHDFITLDILREIPVISSEEQLTVLLNIHCLVELLHLQDKEIVNYYSNPEADMERVFY